MPTDSSISDEFFVPVIDFGPFLDGSDKQGTASAILDSFKRVGFVQLVNHGVDQQRVVGMFEWVSLPFNIQLLAHSTLYCR
jgi:isopenicillin N synthase-like dioxygenase